jgi:flagellar hook-associated protein 1 FlgK
VQTSIATSADAARDSASGVSIDEEMTNMLMYQRAYEGAARVMNAVDEMLDTLVNRVGTVGR